MNRAQSGIDDIGRRIPGSSNDMGGTRVPTPARRSEHDAVDWVLRELRPVSFSFKQSLDSKTVQGKQHYGFIAQEVERALPDVVRDIGSSKAMSYQDFVALLTLAAKDHQERIEQHHGEVGKLRGLLKRLGEKLGHLQKRVSRVIGPFESKAGLRGTEKPPQFFGNADFHR